MKRTVFTARCCAQRGLFRRNLSVRLSVRLSVTRRYFVNMGGVYPQTLMGDHKRGLEIEGGIKKSRFSSTYMTIWKSELEVTQNR